MTSILTIISKVISNIDLLININNAIFNYFNHIHTPKAKKLLTLVKKDEGVYIDLILAKELSEITKIAVPTIFVFPEETDIPLLLMGKVLGLEAEKIYKLIVEVRKSISNKIEKIRRIKYYKLYEDLDELKRYNRILPTFSFNLTYTIETKPEEEGETYELWIRHNYSRFVFHLTEEYPYIITFSDTKFEVEIIEEELSTEFTYDLKTKEIKVSKNNLALKMSTMNEIISILLNGIPYEKHENKVLNTLPSAVEKGVEVLKYFIEYLVVTSEFIKEIKKRVEDYSFLITELL